MSKRTTILLNKYHDTMLDFRNRLAQQHDGSSVIGWSKYFTQGESNKLCFRQK